MILSLPVIILSILNTKDINYTSSKVKLIRSELDLNSVDDRILTTIEESILDGKLPTAEYIKETFSYIFIDDVGVTLNKTLTKDAIDTAVQQLKISQTKATLAEEVSKLASDIETASTAEIKEAFENIIAGTFGKITAGGLDEIPENGIKPLTNAYDKLLENSGEFSLLLKEVEAHIGKAARGDIITILGFVGSFKSTMAMNLAMAHSLQGNNVLYLALENTEERIFSNTVLNYISTTAQTRNDLIRNDLVRDGKLTDEQITIYNTKHNELANKVQDHLIIWDAAKFEYNTFSDMTNTLRKADKYFIDKTGKGLDILYIDQVSLLRQTKAGGRKVGYTGEIINDWMVYFNNQALNFLDSNRKITIFPVSQVGREKHAEASKKKNKGRYGADCASDSNEIERISTAMITLYKDTDTANTILINIPKSRRGSVTEDPIQVEVYGEYAHIGSLNIASERITAEDFAKPTFDIKDLI